MKINTALILCAGFGKRMNPLTLTEPKPLLKIKELTLLENSIKFIESLGIEKIIINTFYLKEKIENFLNMQKFNLDIKIVNDGKTILNTGGGILNMMNSSKDSDFLTLNPDTLWDDNYRRFIKDMEQFYFFKIWNELINKNELYGYESLEKFYHLTNLEVYNEILKNN